MSWIKNYKISTTIFSFIFLYCVLIWCSIETSGSTVEIAFNLTLIVVGNATGWLIGIGISPLNDNERTDFTTIYGALSAFVSGYLIAKIDPIITNSLNSGRISQDDFFHVMIFISALMLTTILTFVLRQYGKNSPESP